MDTNENTAPIVVGTDDNIHITNSPLTTELANEAVPGLLRNSIDSTIVKIRPMATPLDQISRLGNVRRCESMEVEYYSVDARKDRTTVYSVTEDKSVESVDGNVCAILTLADPGVFESSETFAFKGADGKIRLGYVIERTPDGTRVLVSDRDSQYLEEDVELVRLGRAATELDVQSPQFAVLPRKQSNLCQIFKMQIEQSIVMKKSNKEIGWDITDQEEAAIHDMRLGMEKQFLFGKRRRIYDPVKQEYVTLTEGIWNQAGKDINVNLATFDAKALVDMLKEAFVDNAGSRRKVLIAGSELVAALNKMDAERVITARDQVTSWGIDFSELCSKFGRLYVVFSDIFDIMDMPKGGIIIDPEYIQKHVFIPFNAERLDLRGSGQRNTEAMVLTEASCLTLRYPMAHARIIGA